MIDTHSHIYEPEFDEDRDEVVLRAREAGVEHILLPNINRESIPRMMNLCQRYPGFCHPMMGLHPEDVKEGYEVLLDEMERLLTSPSHSYIAVGEVGIDLYWDQTYREEQLCAFERQVCWARDYHLPLVIHTRNAHAEVVEVMERHRHEGLKGVFHCFGGSADEARELLSFEGFALGIGGVLTFKKSKLPDALLEAVPLDRIVVETDSPYLAPTPHRGKRNESSYVSEVVAKLANIYNVEVQEADRLTTSTAYRIFCLPNKA